MSAPEREYAVVLFGATGFAGTQAVRYLHLHAPAGLRWAIAGRNPAKLEALAAARGLSPEVGRIVADSEDPASVARMAAQTRVLASTAGPFARFGDPVVEACVEAQTDYVDITGETPWVRTLIDRFHERAQREGTRIVPLCGLDSVPSDLGTFALASWIREEWGQATRRVQAGFSMGRAGLNGGTLASALYMAESGQARRLGDTLLLNPKARKTPAERARSKDRRSVDYDPDFGRWLAPFVMAPVNTRVVRRSNALLAEGGAAYGPEFAYAEALETKRRRNALGVAAMAGFGNKALGSPFLRRAIKRFAPKPGEGPSEEQMASGWFRCRLVGEAEDGRKALATFAAPGDPGNRSTVRMLCESAFCLALERDALPTTAGAGGLLTPATAFGSVLVRRLQAQETTISVAPL